MHEAMFFLVFWTLIIFASIAWYGFLLFYVGVKGARDIRRLTRRLGREQENDR